MGKKKWILLLSFFGLFSVFLVSSYYLEPQKPAQAACGASTSSCENCHEVKGEDSVSKKGDWHVQHAFGDFCQACHLGVATENDKTLAHSGVIAKPLSQPNQSCVTCHPSDIGTRVAKYGGSVPGSTPSGSLSNETAATTQAPPGVDSNFDLIESNQYIEDKTPWLAWVIGIIDVLVLFILGLLIFRWKKGKPKRF